MIEQIERPWDQAAAREAAGTLFLLMLAAEGIDPRHLTAEQWSAAKRMFDRGFSAGALWAIERANETLDRLERPEVVL